MLGLERWVRQKSRQAGRGADERGGKLTFSDQNGVFSDADKLLVMLPD